jgi:hypothetical protein
LQPRPADATEVIGIALLRKAAGLGHRRIAAILGRSPSTVRRWLRRARDHGHLTRLWQRGAQELIRLDADAFNQLASTGNLLRDIFTILAAAPTAGHHRARVDPHWALLPGEPSHSARLTLAGPGPAPGPRSRTPGSARHDEHEHSPSRRHREHDQVSLHTNYRLFVLTESDAVVVILSAGQQ